MGIFTRFMDIISSNINAMLDKAEDPEKLIKLIIREMEDTLVEIKASCAGAMASGKRVERQAAEAEDRARQWADRATLAVKKGRDDMAREALIERRRYLERAEDLRRELTDHNVIVSQYQDDIRQLEDKLRSAREKQRILVQRHLRARVSMRAQQELRRMDSTDTILKFEEFQNRIERMEAESDLINFARKSNLEAEFDNLVIDEDIEKDLQNLKSSIGDKDAAADQG